MSQPQPDTEPKGLDLPLSRPEAPQMQVPEGEALLQPGDRMPNFILPDTTGGLRHFYETLSGRATVLLLPANTARQDQWDEIKGFAAAWPELAAQGIDLTVVSNDGIDSLAMVSKTIPEAAWFADVNGLVNMKLRNAARFDLAGIVCLLLDADQRVIALRGHEPGHAEWALATYRAQPRVEPATLTAMAPVLLLPAVLDHALCAELAGQLGDAGAAGPVLLDDALAARTMRLLLRRVGPEIDRAFSFDDFIVEPLRLRRDQADTTERERLRIEPDGKGRGFVLLLDLGAEDYEGGEILFPEYGPHRYRPGTGGVAVYADTLLRELRPLTKGRRSLLTTLLRRAVPAAEQA
jgi:hypothetical protein